MFKYLVVYKAEPLHMDFSTDGGHLKAGTLLLPAINSLLRQNLQHIIYGLKI